MKLMLVYYYVSSIKCCFTSKCHINIKAVIAEDPSVPLIKVLSAVLTVISTSEELLAISSIDVPSSLIVTLAPSASRIISASESNVMLPDDKESISAILGVVKVLLVNVLLY